MPFLLFGGSGHPCGMMKGSTGGDVQILPKLIEKGTVSDFLNHQNVRPDQVDQGTQSPLFLCGFGVIGLPLPPNDPVHHQIVLEIVGSDSNFFRTEGKDGKKNYAEGYFNPAHG